MYSFLPSTATRAEPLDWTRLLTNALAVVKTKPSEQVANALAMMDSYAAAAPSLFTNPTRGGRDARTYAALLTSLDDAVAPWPLRLRQLLDLPAVALVSAGAGDNGSLVTVPVGTPRGEALVLLLNVAVGHLEAGLGYVARVRADTAASTSVTTPQGGSVAAPNQNAKNAVQHFRQAVETLQAAEALHTAPAAPSAVPLQHLRSQLPLDVTQGTAVLCAAVARYMYALSSASTKNKPDVLAKLAFEVAQLPLPPSVLSTSSLQLLPSLLLAAYHYHEATWYYGRAATDGPEMAEALGHARYADTLLRTCDAQWGVTAMHEEAADESRQWWGHRLASLFAGVAGKSKSKAGSDDASAGTAAAKRQRVGQLQGIRTVDDDNNNNGNDDDDAALCTPATQYPHLHALLLGQTSSHSSKAKAKDNASSSAATPADVVQVYPYVRLLLHDVCAALQQYERENRVVYFAKVATADEVRRDVPDVEVTSGQTAVAGASEEAVFGSCADLFASLPSPATLQAALEQQEEVGQAHQALARVLQRVEKDGRQLSGYVTPTVALEQALDSLEGLLPKPQDWTSPNAAVAVAVDAVDAALQHFKKTAAEWQEARDVYVGDRCPPPTSVQAMEAEVVTWTERTTAALAQWAALRLPSTVDSRAAFVAALIPRSAEMLAYLEQVEGLSRDVRDVLAAAAGTVTLDQVEPTVAALEKVKAAGTELVAAAAVENRQRRRAPTSAGATTIDTTAEEELNVAPQYEQAEAAVLAVVEVLQAAPLIVTHLDDATVQLREMQQKAVAVPLGREGNVQFRPTAAEQQGNTSSSGSGRAKASPRRAASAKAAASSAATTSSTQSTASRKRSRDGDSTASAEEKEDDAGSDTASVTSSQLEEPQEVAPTPADGATRAAVSGGLLSRMKANKTKRQAEQAGATAVAKKTAKTEKSRSKR